ncbi:MAG: aminoglycoside/hydroxyurea antibiotic resistance kinase [Patescibacteria group bacterium]|nr:aminoglycoside/hydroxyurea antibiotic resistance kinase [Patescibacteria group bacterium]MDE2590468.1 aminoglycoside/hydroxyurea antibiotic resistance kinase [Patescibacteria group bacterium]
MNTQFVSHILAKYKEQGQVWLDTIPQLISKYEKAWEIKAHHPFVLSYNYVAPVTCRDGSPAVLKIGFPQDKEFYSEMEMLRMSEGEGMVTLLRFASLDAVALIEQCLPGKSLRTVDETTAVTQAIKLMQEIWKPVPAPHTFPHIKDWGKGFTRIKTLFPGTACPIPKLLLDKGEKLFGEFCSSLTEEVLLHGDLHQDNILSSGRELWLAIDPKGVIGEKAYETGIWLRNPFPDIVKDPNATQILKLRVERFADGLSLDKQRILGWGFAQAVLSAIWVVEDRQQYLDYYLACAQLLHDLRL